MVINRMIFFIILICAANNTYTSSGSGSSFITSIASTAISTLTMTGLKITYDLAKSAVILLFNQIKKKSTATIICSILLGCAGVYIIYKTILTAITNTLIGFALIGCGIAIILLSKHLDASSKIQYKTTRLKKIRTQ